jgi:hypothetical protein
MSSQQAVGLIEHLERLSRQHAYFIAESFPEFWKWPQRLSLIPEI